MMVNQDKRDFRDLTLIKVDHIFSFPGPQSCFPKATKCGQDYTKIGTFRGQNGYHGIHA